MKTILALLLFMYTWYWANTKNNKRFHCVILDHLCWWRTEYERKQILHIHNYLRIDVIYVNKPWFSQYFMWRDTSISQFFYRKIINFNYLKNTVFLCKWVSKKSLLRNLHVTQPSPFEPWVRKYLSHLLEINDFLPIYFALFSMECISFQYFTFIQKAHLLSNTCP